MSNHLRADVPIAIGTHLFLRASDILKMRPRYPWPDGTGAYYDTGRDWVMEDQAVVKVLCADGVDPERAADILGRKPSAIVHFAADHYFPMRPSWARVIKKSHVPRPRAEQRILRYPFIVGAARDDHALLLAVNTVVPHGLPSDLRSDVCQDILLAVLSGEIDATNIKPHVARFMTEARKRYAMPWGTVSLDAPLWDDGRRLSDVISENPLYA